MSGTRKRKQSYPVYIKGEIVGHSEKPNPSKQELQKILKECEAKEDYQRCIIIKKQIDRLK